jgi:hypothetical protein
LNEKKKDECVKPSIKFVWALGVQRIKDGTKNVTRDFYECTKPSNFVRFLCFLRNEIKFSKLWIMVYNS